MKLQRQFLGIALLLIALVVSRQLVMAQDGTQMPPEISVSLEMSTADLTQEQVDANTPISMAITLLHSNSVNTLLEVDLVFTIEEGAVFQSGKDFQVTTNNGISRASLTGELIDLNESRHYTLILVPLTGATGRFIIQPRITVNGVERPELVPPVYFSLGSDQLALFESVTPGDYNGLRVRQSATQIITRDDQSNVDVLITNTGTTLESYAVQFDTYFGLDLLDENGDAVKQVSHPSLQLMPSETRRISVPIAAVRQPLDGRFTVAVTLTVGAATPVIEYLGIPVGPYEYDLLGTIQEELVQNDMYLDYLITGGNETQPLNSANNSRGELRIWLENVDNSPRLRSLDLRLSNTSRRLNLVSPGFENESDSQIVLRGLELGPYEAVVITTDLEAERGATAGTYTIRIQATDDTGASTNEYIAQIYVVNQ